MLTRCPVPIQATFSQSRPVALAVGLISLLGANTSAQPRMAAWAVDPTPIVTLGLNETDSNDDFSVVVGATRLSDGRILVGDRGSFSLHLFSPDGEHLRAFGRKGAGPGEVGYLGGLLRCGDSLVTLDVDGARVSIFTLDGRYVRSFRFKSPERGRPAYRTVCNRNGRFAHFGWETTRDIRRGVYRPLVPYWLSSGDSLGATVVGFFPGSERYGQQHGTRPLPLGKQPNIALSSEHLFLGTADRFEILVFDLSGRNLPSIRKADVELRTAKEDIAYAKARELATQEGQRWQASIERDYSEIVFPKTVPAYANFRVDSEDNLWVQDYPRSKSPTVRWSVFDPRGTQVAEIVLPRDLEVYEIGRDYILGRFLDIEESIPLVRLYHLRRR